MLSGLDETLMHQGPLPFSLAMLSDHRFYDRYVLSGVRADGQAGILTGMGVYKNLNVMDGYAVTQVGASRQRNLRFSRPLHPIVDPLQIGPLLTEFPEPFKTLRFICAPNEHGDCFDLTFRGFHGRALWRTTTSGRIDGRLHTDYWRFSQVGWLDGTARIEWRRPTRSKIGSVGAIIPGACARGSVVSSRSPAPAPGEGCPHPSGPAAAAFIVMYLGFATDHYSGMIQLQEDEDGKRLYIDGRVGSTGRGLLRSHRCRARIPFHSGDAAVRSSGTAGHDFGSIAAGTSTWSRSAAPGS